MRNQLFAVAAVLMSFAANATAGDFLSDWPTKLKTDSGDAFGVKGLFQYDLNDFRSNTVDPSSGNPLFDDAHTWRRKELDFYAKMSNGLEIDVGYDWRASWTDNYLKYSSNKAGDFRLGQFKTQVGWDSTEDANAAAFLEPSLPGAAAFEGRRLGFDWSYDKIKNWLLSAAYYDHGDLDGQNQGHGYSGRVVYTPVHSKTNVLHLGVAASREYPQDRTAQFSSTPEAGLTKTALVDTDTLPDTRSIERAGLEAGWMNGPLYGQGEYLRFTANRSAGLPRFTGDGFYVFGAWMLTGESRGYKDSYFVNTKPAHAYGAIELALRYSELNLNDGGVSGGRQHDWTVGLNWYLGEHLKLQANYVWAHANDSPANLYVAPVDPRVFELRAQVYF